MVKKKCCVPNCRKVQEDPSVTLHDFPTNPDVVAKWIQNINFFLKNGGTWFPQTDSVICSSHFLPSDFHPSKKRKILKRRSVPSLFVYREEKRKKTPVKKPEPKSPMIVKVIKPATSEEEVAPVVSPARSRDNSPVSLPISSSTPAPLKISQVIGFSGANLPSGNLQFLSSNVTVPQSNFDSSHLQKGTSADGQSSVNNANISVCMPQFQCSTPLNPSQFILLPQVFPPPGGYIIFPSGKPPKPIPPLSGNVQVSTRGGASAANTNVQLNQSPNALSSKNSATNRSLLMNQNKENPETFVEKSGNGDIRPSRSATSSPVDNFEDLICEASSEAPRCNDDNSVIQSNALRNEVEHSQITSSNKRTNGLKGDGVTQKRSLNRSDTDTPSVVKKKKVSKAQTPDLIEIGPNTFMKINPDIIKVSRKQTPSGNTVLQFVMNPNVLGHDLKKPLFSFTDGGSVADNGTTGEGEQSLAENSGLADAHVPDSTSQNEDITNGTDIANGPVVVTTTLPLQHNFSNVRMKYCKALKLKSTQICRLNSKVKALEKKIEELENKCIVQERQLNFASMKKLKAIKKDAEKGVPHAAFILEQIRGYFGKNIRVNWSDTTLVQCSIWCRKAPYAYEYFKKDDLFRLPAKNTIKRFMQRNPEVRLQIKNKIFSRKRAPDESSSSSDFDSDFDFDESDDENMPPSKNADEGSIPVETILTCPPQPIDEDSRSSSGIQFESPVENRSPSKSARNSSPVVSNSEPRLSDKEDADLTTDDKTVRSTESRQPLTNIFGKVLCEMAGSISREKHRGSISSSAISATTKNHSKKTGKSVQSTASDQETVATIIESNGQECMSINDGSNSQELMAIGDGSDSQGLMSVDDGSNSQELMATDACSNHEEMMAVDGFSNDQELMTIDGPDQQKLINSDEASNIEVTTVNNGNTDNYYLQTSEQDGITTINVDGEDIMIPPGTILQLNSDLISTDELGNHFLIIPSAEEH